MKRSSSSANSDNNVPKRQKQGDVYYLKLRLPPTKRPKSAWGHLKQQVQIFDEFSSVKFLHLGDAARVFNVPYHRIHRMIQKGELVRDQYGRPHRFHYKYYCP